MACKMFRGAVLMTALLHLLSANSVASDVSEALSERNTGTTHYAASMFFKCTSDQHVTVTSTAEISALIKQYDGNSPVKIRATRPGWHSQAGFVCPGARGATKLEHNTSRTVPDNESVTGTAGSDCALPCNVYRATVLAFPIVYEYSELLIHEILRTPSWLKIS